MRGMRSGYELRPFYARFAEAVKFGKSFLPLLRFVFNVFIKTPVNLFNE